MTSEVNLAPDHAAEEQITKNFRTDLLHRHRIISIEADHGIKTQREYFDKPGGRFETLSLLLGFLENLDLNARVWIMF